MQPGQQIDRAELSPFLGWLFKSKVRALAVHQHGLVVVTGAGTTFVPWANVQSVLAGTAHRTSSTSSSVPGQAFFEVAYDGGNRVKMPAAAARLSGQRIADLIVKHANLEWLALGHQLPPMAVRPDMAANLRASFR